MDAVGVVAVTQELLSLVARVETQWAHMIGCDGNRCRDQDYMYESSLHCVNNKHIVFINNIK